MPNENQSNSINTGGGAHIGGNVQSGGDFVGRDQIVVQSGARLVLTVEGEPVQLPSQEDLLAYNRQIQLSFSRWADQPAQPEPPLYEQAEGAPIQKQPDAYIETAARPLPMRVSVFRPTSEADHAPAQELVEVLRSAPRAIILGEPGSGKTTALERLAWLLATHQLTQENSPPSASSPPDKPPATKVQPSILLPIFVRLAEYSGSADLIPLCTQALRQRGQLDVTEAATRQLLRAQNVQPLLLLDGFNEFDQAYLEAGLRLIRAHAESYPSHGLYLTCRTADFDAEAQTDPRTQVLADAPLWQVQPLADNIRYWGDDEGESDIRTYLRQQLGEEAGKTLYERLRSDERLYDLAHLPLFLWMFKETAGADGGELPPDRGNLLRRFVRAPRLLGAIPDKRLQKQAEQVLEGCGWAAQQAGTLDLDEDTLYDQLEAAQGRRRFDPEALRARLQETGLLIDRGESGFALLHQLVQEYAAAAYLINQTECAEQLPILAQDEWWRETVILALWLQPDLQQPDYLQRLMRDPAVDLRVRVAAATILGQKGDPRFPTRTTTVKANDSTDREITFIEPRMVSIPGGTALLGGDDPDADDDEFPECEAAIASFELAIYPVTNREFGYFIAAGGYENESHWLPGGQAWLRGESQIDPETEEQLRQQHHSIAEDVEGYIERIKRSEGVTEQTADTYRWIAFISADEYVDAYNRQILSEVRREPVYWRNTTYNQPTQPVVGITWYEAMAYTAWLSQLSGQTYVLPTEAQWEWSARRRSAEDPGRRYPWGNENDPSRANSLSSRLNAPSPVGIYAHGASPDGIHDLGGNVWEWTRSLYRPYPYDPAICEDDESDGLRALRGGSWYDGPERVRCGFRDGGSPRHWSNGDGFRLARLFSL